MRSRIGRQSRRELALASESRAGEWARGKARRAQRQFVAQHWRQLSMCGALMFVPVASTSFLVPSGFGRGFLVGATVASVGAVLAFLVVQSTGTASLMMGDQAERFTTDELRPLRKRGWRFVNRFSLTTGDIDHVLVGPGGAFAIETKWSAEPWQLDPPGDRIRSAARQAAQNAKRLGLWHGFRSVGVGPVEPVVVLWGGGLAGSPPEDAVRRIDDVTVVAGPDAGQWRDGLFSGGLTPEQCDLLWQAMSDHLERRDPVDRAKFPVPMSLMAMTWHSLGTFLAALAGAIAATQVVRIRPPAWWLPAGAALLAAGVWARRWPRARMPALGWLVGVSTAALAILAGVVVFYLG